jgi:hypothetical protein
MGEGQPVWDGDIQVLFSDPYWIPDQTRAAVGASWRSCMDGFLIQLDDYSSVREWSVTIHAHLRSRAMPLTTDTLQYWPDAALERFRSWVNQGCRQSEKDPVQDLNLIPAPGPPPATPRIRRNILDLSEQELNTYRAKLEAIGIAKDDPRAVWQTVGALHTNWCLHYQEAFLLWHRANLLWLEEMIDFPLPYWNYMSPHATEDGHPEAGLPKPFLERTYVHPETGEERPNPLRYAVARDGRSKACVLVPEPDLKEECRYVHRDPVLYTTGDDHRDEREKKLDFLGKIQRQVANSLLWPVFSTPQGTPGYPWANIQSFDPPPPDRDYPHKCDFDGLFEQPHDNGHGWVGPDMADNSYTAYDPVFWSYHSNVDRIFEDWKRSHPEATFTANFPLKPFVGPQARNISTDPEDYLYTTIGDMSKDSRSLGYDYAPPAEPDSSGTLYNEWSDYLYVVYDNVRCIHDTYTIDVFLNLENPVPADMNNDNEVHYIGRMTRLGMGVVDDRGRCIKDGVTRILDGSYNAYYLHLSPRSEVQISQIVTDVTTGRTLPIEEYSKLPGFTPTYVWSAGMAPILDAGAQLNEHHC